MEYFDCDFSNIEGTLCYCGNESALHIRDALGSIPLEGVHGIGLGDCHYISLFFLERIREDFELILFDNHPDDQPPAFGEELISCGGWVANARKLPFCRSVKWIRENVPSIGEGLPVYVSIDIDVLSENFARTDWDQGKMSLDELLESLKNIRESRRVIGVDLCGGITEEKGGHAEDFRLNGICRNKILEMFVEKFNLRQRPF